MATVIFFSIKPLFKPLIPKLMSVVLMIVTNVITFTEATSQCTCSSSIDIGSTTYSSAITVPTSGTLCITGTGGTITSDISWQYPQNGVLCISGTVNFTGGILTGSEPTGRVEIQSGATFNYTPAAGVTIDMLQWDYTFNIVNNGTFNYNTSNHANKYLDLSGVSLTNNGTMGVTGSVYIRDRNKSVNMTLNVGSSLTISGALDQAGSSAGVVTTIENYGSLTALAYWQHASDASNVFNNNTGSTFTLTGTDADAGSAVWPSGSGTPAEVFKRQQGTFSNYGTVNANNGTIGFYGTTTINVMSGNFYSDNLLLPSTLLNADVGCATFHITGVLTVNSGITYAGSVYIYDVTYSEPGVTDNNDIYSSKKIYCGIDPAPATCGSVNNEWLTKPANITYLQASGTPSDDRCNTLPVYFSTFNVNRINSKSVKVKWETSMEVNNEYFTIQKSVDGVNFVDVGKIDGAGNSTSVREYNYIDNNAAEEGIYYRIRQTDYNGKISYSSTLSVSGTNNKSLIANVYPNPITVNNDLSISVTGLNIDSEVTVNVYDVMGNSIYQHSVISDYTELLFKLGKGKISARGVYYVIVSNNGSFLTKNITVE